jgi:flagellar hook-associated protein 2
MTTTTAIPPGTVNTTSSGATFITGTASGLDTSALISAAMAQKTAPADTLDAKVTANQTKIASYQQLQTLVASLSNSISQLASSTFSTTGSTNAFDAKAVSLTASDSSAGTDFLAVEATSSAAATDHTVTVDQLATTQKVASATQSGAALNLTGAFTLNESGGTAATINVTSGMTINDLATAINGVSSTTGVSASVIQASSGSFQLVLSANDTNQPISVAATSGADVLNAIGLTSSSGGFTNVLQAAKPSLVTIDGTQVTSDGNNLTDAVSGLTISLLKTTPTGVSVSMDVTPDASTVKTDITNFVSAYNALRTFVTANQAVGSDGAVDPNAILFADSLLRGVSQTVNSLISSPSASATGSVSSLADLGITLDSGNNMSVSDSTQLDNALLSQMSSVASMFQSSYTPSDSGLKLLSNTTSNAYNFTLDITANPDGTIASASVNGDSSLFTASGNLITGAPGTIYQGLSFAFLPTGNSAVSVNIEPGLANNIVAFASGYADVNTGLIQQQINTLTTQDDAYTSESTQIRSDADTFQTQLVNKYAQMETEVSAAQMMQAQIAAILTGSTSGG